MHRILAAVVLVVPLMLGRAHAQPQRPPDLDQLRDALASGDAGAVVARGDVRIEIGIFGATRIYSRSQAQFVLEAFFAEHPPERVEMGRATGTEQGWFAAVDFHEAKREGPFPVYLRLRRDRTGWVLRELVIRERVD